MKLRRTLFIIIALIAALALSVISVSADEKSTFFPYHDLVIEVVRIEINPEVPAQFASKGVVVRVEMVVTDGEITEKMVDDGQEDFWVESPDDFAKSPFGRTKHFANNKIEKFSYLYVLDDLTEEDVNDFNFLIFTDLQGKDLESWIYEKDWTGRVTEGSLRDVEEQWIEMPFEIIPQEHAEK